MSNDKELRQNMTTALSSNPDVLRLGLDALISVLNAGDFDQKSPYKTDLIFQQLSHIAANENDEFAPEYVEKARKILDRVNLKGYNRLLPLDAFVTQQGKDKPE